MDVVQRSQRSKRTRRRRVRGYLLEVLGEEEEVNIEHAGLNIAVGEEEGGKELEVNC